MQLSFHHIRKLSCICSKELSDLQLQDAHLEGIVSLCENLFSPEIRQCGIAMLLFVTVQKEFTQCEQLYNVRKTFTKVLYLQA